jgi:hypothetical protein
MDFSAPFQAAYHPARAFLFRRGLYVLLAFDAWLVMLEHGGRYGAGGFNVAHFAWLDEFVPIPSPALYVGLLTGSGLAALAMAFLQANTASKLLLAAVYTLSWAISLHDSYQHHYLLSWLLLWSAFTPEVARRDLSAVPVAFVRGIGLPMAALTCAIVYAFTGISKTALEWRSGAVLARLSHSQPPGSSTPGDLDRVRDALMALLHVDAASAFHGIALSVIALQWVVAVGYVAAPKRDEAHTGTRAFLCTAAWLGALSFHLGAELTGMFQIGWFSYYMLWVSFVLLAPVAWVARLGRALGWCLDLERFPARAQPVPAALLALLALGALLVGSAARIDLPGVLPACAVVLALGAGAGFVALRRARFEVWQGSMLAGLIATGCLVLALTQTAVRFDFYRRWAGEVARLGEPELALALYRKAERYAPPGRSRARQIRDLERQLAREPAAPAASH